MDNYCNLPTKRKEALTLGAKYYWPLSPCKHGHASARYTSGRKCVVCARSRATADSKKWRENPENREKSRESAKRSFRKNRNRYSEKIKKYQKEYREKNKENNAYPTWLDWYVSGSLERFQSDPTMKNTFRPKTDIEAAHYLAMGGLAGLPGNLSESESGFARSTFYGALLSFTAHYTKSELDSILAQAKQELGETFDMFAPAQGIKLSARLVPAFCRASGPDLSTIMPDLRAYCWYIDIPHKSLLIGDNQLRAILTQPSPNTKTAAVVAVLTKPGKNEIVGRLAWMVGEHAHRLAMGDAPGEHDLIQANTETVLILSLLYHKSAEEKLRPGLPKIGKAELEKLPRKKQKARQKSNSLFSVRELYLPADNFGRKANEPMEGWKLDHRIEVQGHYRWQPHGEGRKKRKLIWIESYTKGNDLPNKPKISVLRKAHKSD